MDRENVSTETPTQAGKRTVLVVEDSTTQAMHLQTLLENVGLEVVTAPNGERGLQAARDLLPDVIVLDVEMPGMNGFEVYQHLKAEPDTAPIPVILLTCHDDQETVIEGLELGVIEYIPKDTFADVVLVETLRQMGIVK